ncbi:hypothetical protein C4559_05140 [Candidatus Microgenomates bacterium]|nr:MAG: hypothetical protein C4559_05140 [Candidatus Microgenomates bacterium]
MQNCNSTPIKSGSKFKIKKLLTFALLTLTFDFCLLTFAFKSASAFTMSNSNYILKMGNFDMAAGKPTNANYKLGFTSGETSPGLYNGTNYKVRAGFQYMRKGVSFAFAISETLIDFGTLSATNPVTRTNKLTISPGSASSYTVTAFEDHQLSSSPSGAFIPDTTCDNGLCDQTSSALWNNTLTYGFGYRCDNLSGTDCLSDFLPPIYSNHYKNFADNSKSEVAQKIMNGTNTGKNKISQITYKVNISTTQTAGTYNNKITYIATPTF